MTHTTGRSDGHPAGGRRFADPQRCPDCGAGIGSGTPTCSACGLPLRGPVAQDLFVTLARADQLLAALRAASAPAPAPSPAATTTRAAVPARRNGLSAASVPKILLGLGAACLLIAALVFLAVTWSVLGVGGRTATLVGFTVVAGALAAWLATRGLRGAAESLALVMLGLLTLDVFGARAAGWFGDLDLPGFLLLLGALLAGTAGGAALAVRRTAAGELTGAGAVAGVGVGVAAAGISGLDFLSGSAGLVVAVLVAGAATLAARRLQLLPATVVSGAVTGVAWLGLLGSSIDRGAREATVGRLWGELDVWPLLAAAALAAAVALLPNVPRPGRIAGLALGFAVLSFAVALPALDEGATASTSAALAALVVAACLAWLLGRPWGLVATVVQAAAGLGVLATVLSLAAAALLRLVDAAAAGWSGTVGGALPGSVPAGLPDAWLLPASVLVLAVTMAAVARAVPPLGLTSGGDLVTPAAQGALLVAIGTVGLTGALYPVPTWLPVAVLLAAAVGLVCWWWQRPQVWLLVGAAGFAAAGTAVSWFAEGLTVIAVVTVLLASAVVHLRAGSWEAASVAGAVGSAALGGAGWTAGALLDAEETWTVLVTLLVLAVPALLLHLAPERWWRCPGSVTARAGVEVGALVAALPLSVAGALSAPTAQTATWVAVYLTVAGTAVTAASLLRSDRRPLAWPGGALLLAASWVRLADLGVREPEPYTLPAAAALLVLGLLRLRRDPGLGSTAALAPGLGLALVPSLLWVLDEPWHLRSLLLGVACLALVVGGAAMRWTAPLVWGAGAGAVLVVRLAAPYIGDAVPRWVLIGTAGALLVAMGVTWERRIREARLVLGYVRALR